MCSATGNTSGDDYRKVSSAFGNSMLGSVFAGAGKDADSRGNVSAQQAPLVKSSAQPNQQTRNTARMTAVGAGAGPKQGANPINRGAAKIKKGAA